MNGFGDRNTNHCMTPLSASTKCIISYIKKNTQGFFHLFIISFFEISKLVNDQSENVSDVAQRAAD